MEKDDNGRKNAVAWGQSISEMVACLECDRDRLEELKEARESRQSDVDNAETDTDKRNALEVLAAWDKENAEELAELTAASMIDDNIMTEDEAREHIQDSVLEVSVRGDWYSPGTASEEQEGPCEFRILLTTGGPACRIMGELDAFNQPCRAWIEYQDWGTGWQELHGDDAPSQEEILTFAQCFYFGEG